MPFTLKRRSVVPGFGLAFGFTVLYLSLVVLIPLSAAFLKASALSWHQFWQLVLSPRAMASYELSFGGSLVGAIVNLFFGVLVAWVLVRYDFPGKGIVDSLVDLPFALPTAVAGISLATLYSPNGWLGRPLLAMGVHVAYTRLGVLFALTFIGLPFVVRTVQPVLQDLDREFEEAAASLGANRWQTFARVLLPSIFPAALTGFGLAFARAVGEYGSVIFIAGNMPMRTEITPLLIIIKLQEFDYAGATAIAIFVLCVSFVMLLGLNLLQAWSNRQGRAESAASGKLRAIRSLYAPEGGHVAP